MKPDFKRTVALYGGSFDPVHEGHLHITRAVKRAMPDAQMVLVPAAQSPGKPPPLAPGSDRKRWLDSLAAAEGFLVWDTELLRSGPSYTVDTLAEAHRSGAKRERLFWVVGGDAYGSLSQWRDLPRIRTLCRIVALARPGHPIQPSCDDDIVLPVTLHPASSSAIRAALAANPPLVDGLPSVVKSDLENLILRSKNPYARKSE